MFSVVLISVLVLVGSVASSENLLCNQQMPTLFDGWRNASNNCMELMEKQVSTELRAAITYLSMGAHFSHYNVNRPGFANFFIESASEERQHAIKLLEYMLMRGRYGFRKVSPLNFGTIALKEEKPIKDGAHALEEALKLESEVTNKIRNIIINCETPPRSENSVNDYHLVDYLTGDFLTEQYQGQRDLAGKFMTLKKMMMKTGDVAQLGEFLFDKKLLNLGLLG